MVHTVSEQVKALLCVNEVQSGEMRARMKGISMRGHVNMHVHKQC